jgi:hypothetical protein
VFPEVGTIVSFGVSPSNKYLWISRPDNSVSVLDRRSKKIVQTFNNSKEGECENANFSWNDNYIILNYHWGGGVYVYSIPDGSLVHENWHGYENQFSFFTQSENTFGFSRNHWIEDKQLIYFSSLNESTDSIEICCGYPVFENNKLYSLDSNSIKVYEVNNKQEHLLSSFVEGHQLLFASDEHNCAIIKSNSDGTLQEFLRFNESGYIIDRHEFPNGIDFHSTLSRDEISFTQIDSLDNVVFYSLPLNEEFKLRQIGIIEFDEYSSDVGLPLIEPVKENSSYGVFYLDGGYWWENGESTLKFKNFKTNLIETIYVGISGKAGQGAAYLYSKNGIKSIAYQSAQLEFSPGFKVENVTRWDKPEVIYISGIDSINYNGRGAKIYGIKEGYNNIWTSPHINVEAYLLDDTIFFTVDSTNHALPRNIDLNNGLDSVDLMSVIDKSQLLFSKDYSVLMYQIDDGVYAVLRIESKNGEAIYNRVEADYLYLESVTEDGSIVIERKDSLLLLLPQSNTIETILKPSWNETFHEYLVEKIFDSLDVYILGSYQSRGSYTNIERSSVYHYVAPKSSMQLHFKTEKNINAIDIDDCNQFLIYSTQTDLIGIRSLDTDRDLFFIQLLKDNNYLLKLPNSPYYMCSKDASKMLHYVTPSLKVIGFDQLDPIYNRPDIVLDSIGKYFGGADKELIASYREAWEKRVDRLGLVKEMLATGEVAVPDAEIVNEVEYNNTSGEVSLKIKANDPKYELHRFNVLVNEVPIYGSNGISISHLHTKDWDTTVSVPLTVGDNKFQVVVMNELGLQNFKYPEYVNYAPKKDVISKTIYIGLGVDEFDDENARDLKYCVKDVNDLGASLFALGNTDTLLLTNEEVTRENVQALNRYLEENTTVNDRVIVSCSSHGLLDNKNNFYLAMSNTNFSNPQEGGLPYAELEGLLDSIPARQKLLLLDACNSGLNDEDLELQIDTMVVADGNTSGRGVLMKMLKNEQKNSFETMMELFVNVQNESGTVVISAAGGQESALEGVTINNEKIENGAFTYSVMEYLRKDEKHTVNGLKSYTEARVVKLTNGNQKPTSRQETMEVDWELK